jgi:hypothetical protein
VIPNPRQVFDPSSSNKNDGMFLEVMTYAGNITCNLNVIREPDSSHFSHGRIRLLGSRCEYTGAHAALLWAAFQCGRFALVLLCQSPFSNQLIDCRQYFCSFYIRYIIKNTRTSGIDSLWTNEWIIAKSLCYVKEFEALREQFLTGDSEVCFLL